MRYIHFVTRRVAGVATHMLMRGEDPHPAYTRTLATSTDVRDLLPHLNAHVERGYTLVRWYRSAMSPNALWEHVPTASSPTDPRVYRTPMRGDE